VGDEIGNEWTTKLTIKLKKLGFSYLLITRPKEITIFFTLINFLKLNDLKFSYLISNLGFVDLTPKKEEFINDIFEQSPFLKDNLQKDLLCNYELNSGKVTSLYTVNYSIITNEIANKLQNKFKKTYLLGSFEFNNNIKISRKRPLEFFTQLNETNKFIQKIADYSTNILYVDVNKNIPDEGSEISYDAVHFTQSGHNLIFEICLNAIIL
jgi:hypothetical protein